MLASGAKHFLVIDVDGLVWARGDNSCGQLGLGHLEPTCGFSHVKGVPYAAQVAAAKDGEYSTILDTEGGLWMFGKNSGSLGVEGILPIQTDIDAEEQYEVTLSPTKVQNLPTIIMVSCGCEHTIVLDKDGNIWGIGDNKYGQLGMEGKSIKQFTRINMLEDMKRIEKIKCGKYFTVILNTIDELWMTVPSNNEQLGLDNVNMDSTFLPLSTSFKVQNFDCGAFHIVVLDECGGVWVCGDNLYGCLGLGTFYTDNINDLRKIPDFPAMMDVMCGTDSTVLLDANGKVYACGMNEKAELGFGVEWRIDSPMRLHSLPEISQGCISSTPMLVDIEGRLWMIPEESFYLMTNRKKALKKVEGIVVRNSTKRMRNTKSAKK